jgi:hypothetical protein
MPIVAETEDGTMNRIMSNVARGMRALLRRGPTMKFGVNSAGDWLPPVLGPGDWSSAVMASMADRDAAWYFDRRQDDPSA